jgi:hypothetical protein
MILHSARVYTSKRMRGQEAPALTNTCHHIDGVLRSLSGSRHKVGMARPSGRCLSRFSPLPIRCNRVQRSVFRRCGPAFLHRASQSPWLTSDPVRLLVIGRKSLLQLRVLGFGLLQDEDVGVEVLPDCEGATRRPSIPAQLISPEPA